MSLLCPIYISRLYTLCREKKDADQPNGFCKGNPCLCFHINKKACFLMTRFTLSPWIFPSKGTLITTKHHVFKQNYI